MNRFIVAGQPRAGTTFLYHNLQKHPSIFMPHRKEVNYFSVHHERGLRWYDAHYCEMEHDQIGGDVSPTYFLQEQAFQRIIAHHPDTKVILVVRNPADWAISLHRHVQTFDRHVPTFSDFIEGYPFKIAHLRVPLRIAGGFVSRRIEDFRTAFGDHLLIFSFELLRRNPLHVLRCIAKFLDLPLYFEAGNFDDLVINSARRPNLRIINSVLTNERFRSCVESVVPRALIRKVRNWSALMGGKCAGRKSVSIDPNTARIARAAFSADSRAVSALFAECEMQLGSGRPLHLESDGVSRNTAAVVANCNDGAQLITSSR